MRGKAGIWGALGKPLTEGRTVGGGESALPHKHWLRGSGGTGRSLRYPGKSAAPLPLVQTRGSFSGVDLLALSICFTREGQILFQRGCNNLHFHVLAEVWYFKFFRSPLV